MVGALARKPRGNNKEKNISDIIAGAMQWHVRNTS